MKTKDIMLDGLLRQNAVFRMLLGLCSILALSNKAVNGLGMGMAVTVVLICSNAVISLLGHVIPSKVRIPAYVLIIATFVTAVRMLFVFLASKSEVVASIYDAMGIFLPLIVVNCIILARAESFANKNGVGASALDGLFTGLGYMVGLTLMGAVRELLGEGSIFGVQLLGGFRIEFFATSAGAFITYGLLIALFNVIFDKIETSKARKRNQTVVLPEESAKEGA